ncbi:MAG: hypothetical protein WBW04_05070 [Nitrolancea sp.]
METIFLFCFVFGAVFTAISALLGFAGSVFVHLPGTHVPAGEGADLPAAHASHGHIDLAHVGHTHANGAMHAHQAFGAQEHAAIHGDHGEQPSASGLFRHLPLLNITSFLGFLTVFGATGFILMRFAGWSPLWATPAAIVPGVAASVLLALVLGKILAGETVMRPIDYELEGTVGRVTVSIPANGTGEVIFSKGGTRRGEAARSLNHQAIPYDTEVVIVEYEHGIALVQSYEEFVRRYERELPSTVDSDSGHEAEHERSDIL